MLVVRNRKARTYELRPRCKDCHNKKERGHRREWKRKHLRAWRARNLKLVESYWKDVPNRKENARVQKAAYNKKNKEAIAIQRRLRVRLNRHLSLKECKELLERFGRCYPSRYGLTDKGLKECARIRSRLRKPGAKQRFSSLQIRMMVYEDGYYISPSRQPHPYESAAENMRNWQASRNRATSETATLKKVA